MELPLPHLRDEHGRLDLTRLPDDAPWPRRAESSHSLPCPLAVGRLAFPRSWLRVLDEAAAAEVAASGEELTGVWTDQEVQPSGTAHLRFSRDGHLVIAELVPLGEDVDAVEDLRHLRAVCAHREHCRNWPSHPYYRADEDDAIECDSHGPLCKCNLQPPFCPTWCALDHEHRFVQRCCGPSCRTILLASLEARLAPAPPLASSGTVALALTVCLEAGAFDYDRRLEAGAVAAKFCPDDPFGAYELAAAGERAPSSRGARRALLQLLRRMLQQGEAAGSSSDSGLRLGPDCCPGTLNRFHGVTHPECHCVDETGGDVIAGAERAGGSSAAASLSGSGDSFSVQALLESVSARGVQNEAAPMGVGAAAVSAAEARLRTKLHAFQRRGAAWMVAREQQPDTLSLHPAWLQVNSSSLPHPLPPPTQGPPRC